MTATAIRVDGLGKEYQIGRRERGYTTFREAVVRAATAPLRRLRNLSGRAADGGTFWALRDVNFEVRPGEVVGVIGRNGAGKSTLLKVLSRITEPTAGEVTLYGRVGSLLEVGTGFHPELTGRENVYLNGAILGMSRREVAAKFDAIVAFSEVEQFLDTPVKRYSSGMYTRLAFAVAAHLEPEILIVDEVLAVGDAAFQQKCLGKMGEVARGGRTVLFVSHNMAAVESLCDRAVLLEGGRVATAGPAADVVSHYYTRWAEAAPRYAAADTGDRPRVVLVGVRSPHEVGPGRVPVGAPLEFTAVCRVPHGFAEPAFLLGIVNTKGTRVTTLHTALAEPDDLPARWVGELTFTCRVDDLLLKPGEYTVKAELWGAGRAVDTVPAAVQLAVVSTGKYDGVGAAAVGQVYARQQWGLA